LEVNKVKEVMEILKQKSLCLKEKEELLKIIIEKGTVDQIYEALCNFSWPCRLFDLALKKCRKLLKEQIFRQVFQEVPKEFEQIFSNLKKSLNSVEHPLFKLRFNDLRLLYEIILFPDTPPKIREEAKKKMKESKNCYYLYLLLKRNVFSEKEKNEILEMIFSTNVLLSYLALISIPCPKELVEKALKILPTKAKEVPPFIQRVIKIFFGDQIVFYDSLTMHNILWEENVRKILSKELISEIKQDIRVPYPQGFLRTINEVPIFNDVKWLLCDLQEKEINGEKIITAALLSHPTLPYEPDRKVILLRDSRGSYVYRAHPRANSVSQAIAYGFQLDPSKFKGFVEEK
jgi:DNA-binding transcriptional ArsR family regulator